jgi:hypothetical protein
MGGVTGPAAVRSLVASPPVQDLLLSANYLFVAAKIAWHAHKLLIRWDSVLR